MMMLACLTMAIGVSACGKKSTPTEPTACEHKNTQVIQAVEPTCGQDGSTEGLKCLDCGDTLTSPSGRPATGEHDFGDEYKSDASKHWQECSVCGLLSGEEGHNGGAVTCTDKAKCSICQVEYGEDPLGHDFESSNLYLSDGAMHWKKCVRCDVGDTDNKSEHTGGEATCSTQAICSVCFKGYGELENHTYSSTYDSTHHWTKCDNCDATTEKVVHSGGNATCEDKAVCTECTQPYGLALGHDFENSLIYKSNATTHWKQCSRCDVEDTDNKVEHEGGTAICQTQAICTACEASYGSVPGHNFAEGSYKSLNGEHWKVCKDCDAEDNNNKQGCFGGTATCTEKKVCETCQTAYGEPLGHNVSSEWSSDGTHHWHECLKNDCNYIEGKEEHIGGTATCIAKKECTECYKEYGETTSHNYDLTTWGYKGTDGHAHVCTTEGCDANDTPVAHTPDIEEATEFFAQKCTICDFIMANKVGHVHMSSGIWKNDTQNHWYECVDEDGWKTGVAEHTYSSDCDTSCNDCGYVRANISHNYETVTSTTEHWKECSVCGDEQVGSRFAHQGGNATCLDKAICVTCNKAYGSANGHDFANSNKYGSNQTQHWKICANCDVAEESSKVDHLGGTATCQAPANCADCGTAYGLTVAHDFTDNYLATPTEHWQKCKNCDAITTKVAHTGGTATCTEKALCGQCGEAYGSVLGHKYNTESYASDATYHWPKCVRCDEGDTSQKATHTGGTATCSKEATCSTCNKAYGNKAGHSLTAYVSDATYHTKVCANCSYVDTTTKTGHSGGSANCTNKAVCSACGVSYGSLGGHVNDTSKWYAVSGGHARRCKYCERYDATQAHTPNITTLSDTQEQKCTACNVVLHGKIVISQSYKDLQNNTNPNLKYFGYFHADGFSAGAPLTYIDEIVAMDNANIAIINYAWNPQPALERIQYIKQKDPNMQVILNLKGFEGPCKDGASHPHEFDSQGRFRKHWVSLIDNWQGRFDTYYNLLKPYVDDGTIYAYYFDEPYWYGIGETEFVALTKYIREKDSRHRIMSCCCSADIGAWDVPMIGGGKYQLPSKNYHQYVTDITYDIYDPYNANDRATYIQMLLALFNNPSEVRIWGCLTTWKFSDKYGSDDPKAPTRQKDSLMGFYNEAINNSQYYGLLSYTFAGGSDPVNTNGVGARHWLVKGQSYYSEEMLQLFTDVARKIMGEPEIAKRDGVYKELISSFDHQWKMDNLKNNRVIYSDWNVSLNQSVKRTGISSLKLDAGTTGDYPELRFRHNSNEYWNLSTANYVSFFARSTSGNISNIGICFRDKSGNNCNFTYTMNSSGWTEFKATVEQVKAKGVNVSECQIFIANCVGGYTSANRTSFYIDDVTIYYSQPTHTHSYGSTYNYDGTKHWQVCTGCGEGNYSVTSNHAGGTATCTKGKVCTTCGAEYTAPLGHDYTVTQNDATYHWKKCSRCTEVQPNSKVKHGGGEATCTTQATCTGCNQKYGSTVNHDFISGDYGSNGEKHWKQCVWCGTPNSVKTAHSGGVADCTQGKKCEICQREYTEKLAHDFTSSTLYGSDGISHYKLCAKCNAGDTANKTTCTGGSASCILPATCSTCNNSYGSALGHSFTSEEYLGDNVYHWKKCIRCTTEDTANKSKHTSDDEITCTSVSTCNVCNMNFGSASGHDFDNGDYTGDGTHHWKQCANCTAQDTENKVAHKGGTATCQAKAICRDCDAEYGDFGAHDYDQTSYGYIGADGHAFACKTTGCRQLSAIAPHVPNIIAPTLTDDQVCTKCEYIISPALGHTHTPKSEWNSNDTQHWHDCVGNDGEKFAISDHVYTNDCDSTCNTCNYTREVIHDFVNGAWINTDGTYHWKQCANCNVEDTENRGRHTYDNACDPTCNGGCGYERSELVHDFNKDTYITTDSTYHWKKCSRCDVQDTANKQEHVYDNACDKECNICAHTRTTTHDFDNGEWVTDNTSHWKTCSVCSVADTNKVAHTFDNDCDATCNGNCGYERSTSHSFTEMGTSSTEHWTYCSVCSTEQPDSRATHSGGSADCLNAGKCSTCDVAYIDALGHSYTSGVYANGNNQHWQKCVRCNEYDTENKTNCSGGNATCIKKAVCSTCSNEYGNLVSHTFNGDWATNDTQHWRKCSVAGCTAEDTSNKSNHSGGIQTYWAKPVCGTCNTAYGSATASKAYTITEFNDAGYAYITGGDYVEGREWDISYTSTGGVSGGFITVVNDVYDEAIGDATMTFRLNNQETFNLSTAKSVTVYLKSSSGNITWLSLNVMNSSGTVLKSINPTVTTSWTAVTVELNGLDTEELKTAKIAIKRTGITSAFNFGIDNFIITDNTTTTAWNTVWKSNGSTSFEGDINNDVQTNNAGDWDIYSGYSVYSDPVHGSWNSLKVVPHESNGTWLSLNFKKNGSTTWNLNNSKYISIWVNLSDMLKNGEASNGEALTCLRLGVVSSSNWVYAYANATLTPNGGWVKYEIDMASWWANNSGADLSSVQLKFYTEVGSAADYNNHAMFYLDDLMVLYA